MQLQMMMVMLLLASTTVQIIQGGVKPILIVPGLSGSQLYAKSNISGQMTPECNSDEFSSYWVNISRLPVCLAPVVTLEYDNSTKTYSNISGVEVIVPGFGGTETVEYLDTQHLIPHYNKLVSFFVQNGYVRGETIRAAPYDWRLAADELNRLGYYDRFQSLVEEMFEVEGEKVTIVAHSMGGPIALYFLNQVTSQKWKDKYINAFVPLSGGWSGGNEALGVFLSGLNTLPYSIIILDYLKTLTPAARSLESLFWMMPNPGVWGDEILVTTPVRNYSANQYREMLSDFNRSADYFKLEDAQNIHGDYPSPNVPVHCFYGVNLTTPTVFHYGLAGNSSPLLNITTGDGDNTVNLRSSEVCLRWSNQSAPFTSRVFPCVGHSQMVTDQAVLNAIAEIVGIDNAVDDGSLTTNASACFLIIAFLLVINMIE